MELMADPTLEVLPRHGVEAQDVRQYTMEAMKVLHRAATGSYPSLCLPPCPHEQTTLARDPLSQLELYSRS